MIKELQTSTKASGKNYEDIYKQVAIFLNYFTIYHDFFHMLNDKMSVRKTNRNFFAKLQDYLLSVEDSVLPK